MVKVAIVCSTISLRPGIVGFRIGLLGVTDEGTVVERFNEGWERWEYLVMIHDLKDLPLSFIRPRNIVMGVEVYWQYK
jgi:hypothetical protein